MKTVVFNIQTLDSALADFAGAWKTGKGDVFPYDKIHVDFEIPAAA